MHPTNPPELDLHQLKSAGLTPPFPLPLRAVPHIAPLPAETIKKHAGSATNLNNLPTTITSQDYTATTCTGISNFELSIGKDFVSRAHTVRIKNCHNFRIKATDDLLPLDNNEKFFITITDCHAFTVQGLQTTEGRTIILTSHCSDFTLSNCKSQNASGYGIIVHNSNTFTIDSCTCQKNLCGFMVLGNSTNGLLTDCTAKDIYGFYNCDAGIHICATSPDITLQQIPEQCHEPLSIEQKTYRPQNIFIKECLLTQCRSQGIYLEGAVNCLIENTIISRNNKEGICFDWGSCYNLFLNNTISLNGERGDMSEEERRADFITEYPVLKDGSSSMKLPAISLDNGCLNLIDSNKIIANYGGGIKMIRSAILNTISNNLIVSNALGKNGYIPFFHGISLLGVGAVNNEFTGTRNTLLSFVPSTLNTIDRNTIQNHSLEIFQDTNSKNNFFTRNRLSKTLTFPGRIQRVFTKLAALVRRISNNCTPSRN